MKAAIYARFSTDEQREASINDQFRECERLAASTGLEIVNRFEDRGVSGGTHQRLGYQALLSAARAHEFEVIIAEDISRLWRNRAEFGQRSAELEDLDVHLITCVGDDTRRDGYGLVLGIKQAIAEHYRREVSYRTRRGLEGKALAGGNVGTKTYGYIEEDKIDAQQAEVVKIIFREASHGDRLTDIARGLNLRGIPAPRGGRWSHSTLWSLLRNPRYTGAVIWGRTAGRCSAADSARKTRLARSQPLVQRQDESRRIISDELWQRVIAARQQEVRNDPPAPRTGQPQR